VAGLITFTSSVTGFPPLAVIAVLAGTLRMSFPVFLATVLAGRTIRFWAVLAGVGLLFGH
jgi:membrane protein YqaA with SNARE-associated domain